MSASKVYSIGDRLRMCATGYTAPSASIKKLSLGASRGFHAIYGFAVLASLFMATQTASSAALQTVTITNVVANSSSVKVEFSPVPGAVDYRIYDVNNPTEVKYAGTSINADMWNNYIDTTPKTSIEWNAITPGQTETLVVQAVDQLGPFPQGNLYDSNNKPQFPAAMDSMSVLGSNEGMTLDGNLSINGQGNYTNVPNVIGQSAPFTVTPTSLGALPSSPNATQVNFDDFPSATFSAPTVTDQGFNDETINMKSVLNWIIQTDRADVDNTKMFVMNHHFMDVLFDGGTYEQGPTSMHTGHGGLFMSPQNTADFSNGQVLHMTMEVDGHFDARRWCEMFVTPSDDPITQFDTNVGPLNNSGNAVSFMITNNGYVVTVWGKDADGNQTQNQIISNSGNPQQWTVRTQDGTGLDDRVRFDMFLSQNHVQIYENGKCVGDDEIKGGIPFTSGRAYFAHYCYHTGQEVADLQTYRPYEKYWLSDTLFSDERHWSNMGFEVLPSSSQWSTMASHVNETAPLPSAVPASTGSGSGSGNSGNNPPTNGNTGTSSGATITGVISSIAQAAGQPSVATIVGTGGTGTVNLTTSDPTIGGQLIAACAAETVVTVNYAPNTGGVATAAAVSRIKKAGTNGKIIGIKIKH